MPFLQSKQKSTIYHLKDTLPFGKHAGETLQDVIDEDSQYVEWLIENMPTFDISVNALDYLNDATKSLIDVEFDQQIRKVILDISRDLW